MRRMGILLVATSILVACASRPADIAPVYQSEAPYRDLSCDELRETLMHVNTALSNASAAQSDARALDGFGIFMVGLPVASMTGRDSTAQVAVLKGHQQAIMRAGNAKECGSLAPIIEWD